MILTLILERQSQNNFENLSVSATLKSELYDIIAASECGLCIYHCIPSASSQDYKPINWEGGVIEKKNTSVLKFTLMEEYSPVSLYFYEPFLLLIFILQYFSLPYLCYQNAIFKL